MTQRPAATGRALVSAGPGAKWDPDGNAQRFRGNTFVFPVPQDSAFYDAQKKAQRLVAESRFVRHFALTPIDSFHMTLFDGLAEAMRGTEKWPSYLPADATMPAATMQMFARLDAARLDVPSRVVMTVAGMKSMITTAAAPGVKLQPNDAATGSALSRLRHQLADTVGLPYSDQYAFHSTLGYRLVAAEDSEHDELNRLQRQMQDLFTGDARTVALEPAAFNCFDDMLAFPQIKIL